MPFRDDQDDRSYFDRRDIETQLVDPDDDDIEFDDETEDDE